MPLYALWTLQRQVEKCAQALCVWGLGAFFRQYSSTIGVCIYSFLTKSTTLVKDSS